MPRSRRIPNFLSLSRIGIGMLFVIFFQRTVLLFWVCLALCLLALATDNLDGYFARRSRVTAAYGRMWDSLGDKAFYVAVIVSLNAQGFLGALVSWALIVREVALYITRIMFIHNYPTIERTRPLTNLHGKLMWVTIGLGLSQMYAATHGLAWPLYTYTEITAYAALAFGIGSMVQFMKLG